MFRLFIAFCLASAFGNAVSNGQETFVAKDAVLQTVEERRVPSLISGVISKSHVQEGTLLKTDQAVMEIDAAMAFLNLSKLEKERDMTIKEASTTVELEYVKRSIQVAKAELGRALRSNESQPGAITRSEIDQLTMMVERAIAEQRKTEFQIQLKKMLIEVKNVEVSIGQKKIEDHHINSPVAGMVVEIFKKEGEWVEASESVAKIARLDKLKTEIKMPAAIALENLVGSPAIFTPNLETLDSKQYSAKVIFVHPSANPVNASVRVWVEVENEDLDLIPGLTGRLEIRRGIDPTERSTEIGQKNNR